jgi:hypothetical protein
VRTFLSRPTHRHLWWRLLPAAILFAGSHSLAAHAAPSTDRLVGYWKFDEGAENTCSGGQDVCDLSGHGNHGTIGGGDGDEWSADPDNDITFTNPYAMEFDGTNDVVTLPSISISSHFSVAMWLDLGVWGGGSEGIIDRGGNGGTQTTMTAWRGGSTVTFYTNDGSSTDSLAKTAWPSGWHHVVFYNAGTDKRIYIDGAVAASKTATVTPTDSGKVWNLSALSSAGGFANAQKLDDVRIYNRALSGREIAELAAGGHPTQYWKGTSNTSYEGPGNWSGSFLPDPYTNVVIPWTGSQPVTMTGAIQAASLTIQTGAALRTNGTGITINDSGTFTNYGTLQIKGNETFTNLTNDTAHGTVLVYGTGTLTSLPTGSAYHDFTLSGSAVWNLDDDVTIGGRLALSGGTLNANGNTVAVTGLTILDGGTFQAGAADHTLSGGLLISGGTFTGGAGLLDLNGNLTLVGGAFTAPSGTTTVSSDWVVTGGTFNANGGTVDFDGAGAQTLRSGGQSFDDLSVSKSVGALTLSTNDLTVGGAFTINGGTFAQGSVNLTVSGDVVLASGVTFTRSPDAAKRFILAGELTLTDSTAAKQNLGYVQIGASPDTTDLASDIVAWRLDVGTGDVLNTNGYDITVGTGGLTVFGTLDATDDATGDSTTIVLAGDWTKKAAAAFTHGGGTVTLNGGDQTLYGATSFGSLGKTGAIRSDTLTFPANENTTVSGSLLLATLTIASSLPGTAAVLTLDAQTGIQGFSSLTVADNDASRGRTLDCTSGCIDSGNNINWLFPVEDNGFRGAARVRRARAFEQAGGGGGGGVATGTGSASTVFAPDYSPLAQALKDAQERAREQAVSTLPDPRKVPAIRDALIARFREQIALEEQRAQEQEALHAAFFGGQERLTSEQRRLQRAQVVARERSQNTSASSPSRIAQRRGLLLGVLGAQEVVYRDVPVDAWFAPYVALLIEEGIAEGYKNVAGAPTGEFGVSNAVTYAEVLKMALEASDTKVAGTPRNASAAGTWASAYVATAESLQLSLFTPAIDVHAPASRGAVIQTILEVLGIPTDIKIPSPFSDVVESHVHANAIITAAAFGLVEGDTAPDGSPLARFRPDAPVNRAEVSKIVTLARGLFR